MERLSEASELASNLQPGSQITPVEARKRAWAAIGESLELLEEIKEQFGEKVFVEGSQEFIDAPEDVRVFISNVRAHHARWSEAGDNHQAGGLQ